MKPLSTVALVALSALMGAAVAVLVLLLLAWDAQRRPDCAAQPVHRQISTSTCSTDSDCGCVDCLD